MAPACSRQVSRLSDVEGDKPVKKKFKSCPIGYIHIDIAEVQTAEDKLQRFIAIDRICKLAYAELHTNKKKMTAVQSYENQPSLDQRPGGTHEPHHQRWLSSSAITFTKRLKTLKGLTPYEEIIK